MTHRQRHGEAGFTLIETVVSMALLVLIAGAIAGATSIGLHTVQSGGAGDRLAGDHDLFELEQMLGRDMARAECVYNPQSTTWVLPGYCKAESTSKPAYSTCASPPSMPSGTTTVLLCVAWSEFWETPGTCHTAAYYRYAPPPSPGGTPQSHIYRNEAITQSSEVYTQHLTTEDVSLSAISVSAGDVQVTLTANAPRLASPPGATYHYRPLGTISQSGTQLC